MEADVPKTSDQKQEHDLGLEIVWKTEIPQEKIAEPIAPSCHPDVVCLSGGSVHGILTLGALQYALDRYIIAPAAVRYYMGTSSGAIIAYLLAIGYTPREIMVQICTEQVMEKLQPFNIATMFQGQGAIAFEPIHNILERMSINKLGFVPTMGDISERYGKKLEIITYNRSRRQKEILTAQTHPNLSCLTALRMSSNLPFIFPDFCWQDEWYIDGAVADNFPIDRADAQGAHILGVLLVSSHDDFQGTTEKGFIEEMYELFLTPINQATEDKIEKVSNRCTIVRLCSRNFRLFNFSLSTPDKLNMFSEGYQQMKAFFEGT